MINILYCSLHRAHDWHFYVCEDTNYKEGIIRLELAVRKLFSIDYQTHVFM